MAVVCSALNVSVIMAGDQCSNPTPISGTGVFPFNLVGTTTSGEGQDHCVINAPIAFDNDVWYCWTATCTGLIDISTCGQTTVDTKISFYVNGCACPTPPPSQPPLCCADDGCGLQESLTCEVVCGQQYLIRLGTKPGAPPGSGTFTINCIGSLCEGCDDCCGKRPNFITNAGFGGSVAVVTQESGVNTRVVDYIDISAPQPAVGSNVNWNAPFYSPTAAQDWSNANLGTVFGVTLDDLGHTYLTHTSVYSAWFASGDTIGTIPGGAPGAIYKINTNTGVPSVFAVLPNAAINNCTGSECWPGLGNICYSCTHASFYVSNFEDGRIYRLDASGTVLQTWKHATGVIMNGGGLDPFDTNGFSPITPHPTTQRGQRVWAVRVSQGRLYYSVWREDAFRPDTVLGNEIWSVGLFPSGGFIAGSEQLELVVPSLLNYDFSNPVSDISFKPLTCCMLLAERSMYDDTTSWAHDSRLLEYCKVGGIWTPSGNNFDIGSTLVNSSAGGCDYDFDTGAGINVNVWATGDAIKLWDPPVNTDPAIYGIGGMTFSGTNPYANGLMIDSNQDTINGNKFMQGSMKIACPDPNPPICEPLADGTACKPVHCDSPVLEECQPRCILIGHDGVTRISVCDCNPVDQCFAAVSPAGIPECIGFCPQGQVCIQRVNATADGTEYCCECVNDPPECVPASDGQSCVPFVCDNPAVDACKPRCARIGADGVLSIIDCNCRGVDACHVVLDAVGPHCTGICPPGTVCVENRIQNSDGSIDICCDCVEQVCDCPGDLNGDGIINGADIQGFVQCYMSTPQPGDNCACADIDGNGIVDLNDMTLFVNLMLTKAQCNNTPCCPAENLSLDLATGVDSGGNLIPVGSDDDNWIVTLDASGGIVPRPASVIAPHPFWQTIPGTQWISADYNGPNGDYEYDFCFCLDDRFQNPVLTLQIRADDDSQVYLNGNFIGNGGGFNAAQPAMLSTNNAAFFVAGQNCVKVVVQNIGGAPTGINLAGTVTAVNGKCCCPPRNLGKSIDTGVDDNTSAVIPIGMDDDTWTVTCEPAPGGTLPRPATVISPHPAWLTIPGTQWISAAQYGPNGWYCYEYCFCLDPRFKNPVLNLQLRADDYAEVYLNGTLVGATPNGWAFNTPQPTSVFVTNPSLFQSCENCIEVRVLNGGGVVTGFNLTGTISAEDGLCCDVVSISCCQPDGTCINLAPGLENCPMGGTPIDGPCKEPRGCCMPDGFCLELEPHCCEELGGHVLPVGVHCAGQMQACCIAPSAGLPGTCIDADPACCTSIYGGTPMGTGQMCQGDGNGNGVDDACEETPDCHVNPATGFCAPTICPVPGEECLPKCALVESATGQMIQVFECDCQSVWECHMTFLPPANTPSCIGDCPIGTVCQTTVTDLGNGTQKVCCECVPEQPQCLPDPLTIGCTPTACPVSDEVCRPVCVRTSGGVVTEVLDCVCKPGNECHVEWDPGFVNPHCVGDCPPGMECTTIINPSPDGTSEELCCICQPQAATYCPTSSDIGGQLCQALQSQQCPAPVPTTTECRPQVVITNGPGQGVTVVQCSCMDNDSCGAIDIQEITPGNYFLTCVGACQPASGWTCYVHVDGFPAGVVGITSSNLPAGSIVTCRCAP